MSARPLVFVLIVNLFACVLLWGSRIRHLNLLTNTVRSPSSESSAMISLEAEDGFFSGTTRLVEPTSKDPIEAELGREASHRKAVILDKQNDGVAFKAPFLVNAFVLRFSVPDASIGGGKNYTLNLTITDPDGKLLLDRKLTLSSRYSWLYGREDLNGKSDGVRLVNRPPVGDLFKPVQALHLYDEIQLMLPTSIPANSSIQLTKKEDDLAPWYALDMIDLEMVPAPLSSPAGYLSLTDDCNVSSWKTNDNNAVAFDGKDASSFGETFHAVTGWKPNPLTCCRVNEKDYYTTEDPELDQKMWDLAFNNKTKFESCIKSAILKNTGIFVPPGLYYIRGKLDLLDNLSIVGAGKWYSKFAAVNTMKPVVVEHTKDENKPPSDPTNGIWLKSESGNFSLQSFGQGRNILISGLAFFGNVTQRDPLDEGFPQAIHGNFIDSVIKDIWVEHYFEGLNSYISTRLTIDNCRVRNTLADGIALYGSNQSSMIKNSTVRSTGDDGLVIWAFPKDKYINKVSSDNQILGCQSELQWFGNGISIYGGLRNSVQSSQISDVLYFPCLQISTAFRPFAVPMTAVAENLELSRCGGNGFGAQYGALLAGVQYQPIEDIQVHNIKIFNPEFKAIDLRQEFPGDADPKIEKPLNIKLSDIKVYGIPSQDACMIISGEALKGQALLQNVCREAELTSACMFQVMPKSFEVQSNGNCQ